MIDEITYALPITNYVPIESKKTRIIIAHTFNHDMKHVTGWLYRYNGKYKKTAAFTIDAAGSIYKHFDPKYQARFFNNNVIDTKTIVILLENDGWLTKDSENNAFITCFGHIYKKPSDVIEKKWRGNNYWAPYSNEQVDSTVKLIKTLCAEFKIPMNAIGHNTKIDELDDNIGIIYRSNLDKHFTDLSPTWDFNRFKELLENK
jgi:hypothetical protein